METRVLLDMQLCVIWVCADGIGYPRGNEKHIRFIERQPLQNVYIGDTSDAYQLVISNVTGIYLQEVMQAG